MLMPSALLHTYTVTLALLAVFATRPWRGPGQWWFCAHLGSLDPFVPLSVDAIDGENWLCFLRAARGDDTHWDHYSTWRDLFYIGHAARSEEHLGVTS